MRSDNGILLLAAASLVAAALGGCGSADELSRAWTGRGASPATTDEVFEAGPDLSEPLADVPETGPDDPGTVEEGTEPGDPGGEDVQGDPFLEAETSEVQGDGVEPTPDEVETALELPEVEPDIPDSCEAQCAGRQCGPDGCGGDCGTCAVGLSCADGKCVPPMIDVPAGAFKMGCNLAVDGECGKDEDPVHDVTLSAYRIGKYEVTQAAFKACRDAGGCKQDPSCDWDPAGKAGFPVVCVDWSMAREYCEWACPTCRLCTEAEWERAARGTDGRKYPWSSDGTDCPSSWGDACAGSAWTSETAQANCGEGTCHDGFAGTSPVGSFPSSPSAVGALDMAGNVWEWVRDVYGSDYYCKGPAAGTTLPWTYCSGAAPFASPWKDPQGPASGSGRVARGGSFYGEDRFLRTSFRGNYDPLYGVYVIGARCCSSAP